MPTKHENLTIISKRLLAALLFLLAAIAIIIGLSLAFQKVAAISYLTVIVGAIGGFVSLQRRLKDLSDDDLILFASSHLYTFLAPVVGGILALLLYLLFLSGLVTGELFPTFVPDEAVARTGFLTLLDTRAAGYQDYAKLLIWSFIAGFSETFVIDIIGRFHK